MDELIELSRRRVARTNTDFVRSLAAKVSWENRLIGIRGARGTGKTTLLLQRIKTAFADNPGAALYVSLDNVWFMRHSLPELAGSFVRQGGKFLFLDEVHKYPEWPRVLKNLYDDYPELAIVFTGSSLLTLLDSRADLSRRAVLWTMQGLLFREYLNLTAGTDFPVYRLEDILEHNERISAEITANIKPFVYWKTYLQTGYYPYFTEGLDTYGMRLEETVAMILEIELPLLRQARIGYVPKIKQLLGIIAESAPFIPNVSRLADRAGINRQTLLSYLAYLQEARLTRSLYRDASGISLLQKPDKLLLENTNLMYLFSGDAWDWGNVRETFIANQLGYEHKIEFPETGDFLVDGAYLIEVGGKNKTRAQLRKGRPPAGDPDAWIAADNIEYGAARKIPLWLFGFLY